MTSSCSRSAGMRGHCPCPAATTRCACTATMATCRRSTRKSRRVRVAIVGAGYIGLECAATFRAGARRDGDRDDGPRDESRRRAGDERFYQAEHAATASTC
jgi:threonine dehydrogenase-like Zn-dependent dehydrogenase